MTQTLNLENKRFGNLVAIERSPNRNKKKEVAWLCQCDCGNKKIITRDSLTSGNTTTCGCSHRKRRKRHHFWKGYGEISGKYWYSVKRVAKKRGYEFDITIEHAWDIYLSQNRKCALSNFDIQFAESAKDEEIGGQTASLDRIDSTQGYVKDNIQWVHKDINALKKSFSEQHLYTICQSIVHKKKDEIFNLDEIQNCKRSHLWKGYKEIHGKYWGKLQRAAKQKNRQFDITLKYIWNIYVSQKRKCALSGLAIHLDSPDNGMQTASLDRIDSSKGYVQGNVQWLHKDINFMKWDFNQSYFIKMCNAITNNLSQTKSF